MSSQLSRFEIGAAQLSALRAKLGGNLAERYGRHQPATKNVPSQYRDSGQISINFRASFPVSENTFTNWNNVEAAGSSTVYTSFKPNRIVLTQMVTAIFDTGHSHAASVGESATASDLLVVGAYSGSLNTFPNAPSAQTGIHGPAIAANAFGVGISWPTVNAGIPVSVNVQVLQTALYRAPVPTGFSMSDLVGVYVDVFFAMFGPQLR